MTETAADHARRQVLSFIEEVWNRGDADAARGYLASDYTIANDPGDPWEGQVLSPDDFVDRVRRSRAAAPDQRFTPVHVLAEAGRVAVAWEWEGTHAATVGDIPATGRRTRMTGMTVYLVRDGRIAGHWQVADRLGFYRQIAGPP